ncbi:MAG: ABC transporter ATP-binding protein [Planctomycetota bacterium]|jgi:branched-chain amino acid transport system ATP-binding protein|nr:ABC transporter ATP-binding protein [Planctomycetota bacterium]
MLRVKDLRAWYGNLPALRGIDFHLEEGELVTLIGSNGAGKSTTLKSLIGLLPGRSGEIEYLGESLLGCTPAGALARGMAMVPEGRWIFPDLTVEENLRLGAFGRRGHPLAVALEREFARFPVLGERRRQKGGTLSGGEQQMLAISRALMSNPRLLLLDEPSLGLAPLMVEKVFALIRDIRKGGIAVLLVEQNSAQALAVADRGYVLSSGRVIISGPAADLLRDPRVGRVYLGYQDFGGGI